MEFDKETMKSLMIDHIDGKITGELAQYVERHIEKNPDAKVEYEGLKEVMELMAESKEEEVPKDLKPDFLKAAQSEIEHSTPNRQLVPSSGFKTWLRIAAAVAFVIMGYLGANYFNQSARDELQALQSELQKTKELVLLGMMKEESASERLKGILASSEIEEADEEIIDALITAMNNDDNINVRIAAAEALASFGENEKARLALIASLNHQPFPAVQMKLIDILVVLGDRKALEPMQEFTEKDEVIKSVKDEAHMGIFKLM